MDKEIIDLLKSLAGSTETLVIWYMILHFVSNMINWIGGVACMYWLGRGARGLGFAIKKHL
jgi:hypothetical protein